MLISFSLSNWMSFRDQVTFSMIAGKESQHRERIARIKKYRFSVLPIAAIYGANASGKTNLFQAINFAKNFIVKNTQLSSVIPVENFRLDEAYGSEPTRLSFTLLIDEKVFEYSFAVLLNNVTEEKIVEVLSASEKVLFDRFSEQPLHRSLKRIEHLRFALQGTRDNQLFLTNSVYQKIDTFKPLFDWFDTTLEIVAPDTRFENFESFIDENDPLYPKMNQYLSKLDTGIDRLGSEEIALENSPIPEEIRNRVQEVIKENETVRVIATDTNERYLVTRTDGKLISKKLVSYHLDNHGQPVKFEMRQESDGSQRMIDLLPAFLEITQPTKKKVYVIDEIDRSLHTLLTRQLLELYTQSCSADSRSQMIMTTHDVLLMDQSLLRRDEIWVVERDRDGASSLISFDEYTDIRADKKLAKNYLLGRMGGTPKLIVGSKI